MAGLISIGMNTKSNALRGMRRLTSLEKAREREEKMLDAQDKADRRQNQVGLATLGGMGGAMLGAKMGALGAFGGPIGFGVGAGLGFLAGSLF